MGIACVIVLLAGQIGAEGAAPRPLFEVGEKVEVTVAEQYRAEGISILHGRRELVGRLVAEDERTLTVMLPDEGQTVRYPAGGVSLAGTVVALDDKWLTLDLGDGQPHVRVPLTALDPKAPASPQETFGVLRRGTRVRVHFSAPGARSLTGRVLEIDDESMLVRASGRVDPLRLQRSSIRRLEVAEMRPGSLTGALVVGALGASFGALVGASSNWDCSGDCHPAAPFLGAAVGSLTGGMVGSLLGSRVERWQPVPAAPVRVSVAPGRRRGVAASLSFRF